MCFQRSCHALSISRHPAVATGSGMRMNTSASLLSYRPTCNCGLEVRLVRTPPLRVDQAALDKGVRSEFGARFEDDLHPVAHEHIGWRDPVRTESCRQWFLAVAPLTSKHLAAHTVNRGSQAAAIHIGTTCHDHAIHHTFRTIRPDMRFKAPTP